MKRILLTIVVLAFLAACGKDDGGESQTVSNDAGDQAAATDPPRESTQAIPDEPSSGYDEMVEGRLFPAFDRAGTELAKTVAAGDMFELYVVSSFNDAFSMSGAEYKLSLPDGISVLGTTHTDSMVVMLGTYDHDFMIAFHCIPGPGDWITRYLCKVEDDFAGGIAETMPGENLNFIGFVLCDELKTEVRAKGATAEIKIK